MNLIWRFLWMLICAHASVRWGARDDIMGEGRISYRCLPTDLDFNMHMTNSRYASFADLSRVNFMIRNGAWKRLRDAKLFPVLGSATFRFRRAIGVFQAFTVTTSILTWDDKWVYILHKFITADDVPAIGVVKATFVSKEGRAPIEKIVALMGYTDPRPEHPVAKEVTDLDLVLRA